MMETPALDLLLAGVENRPEATLGELLGFMNAFNLRFGAATTPDSREAYDSLYPKLVDLRNQIAPAVAAASPTKTTGGSPGILLRDGLQGSQKASPCPCSAEARTARPTVIAFEIRGAGGDRIPAPFLQATP